MILGQLTLVDCCPSCALGDGFSEALSLQAQIIADIQAVQAQVQNLLSSASTGHVPAYYSSGVSNLNAAWSQLAGDIAQIGDPQLSAYLDKAQGYWGYDLIESFNAFSQSGHAAALYAQATTQMNVDASQIQTLLNTMQSRVQDLANIGQANATAAQAKAAALATCQAQGYSGVAASGKCAFPCAPGFVLKNPGPNATCVPIPPPAPPPPPSGQVLLPGQVPTASGAGPIGAPSVPLPLILGGVALAAFLAWRLTR